MVTSSEERGVPLGISMPGPLLPPLIGSAIFVACLLSARIK